MGHSVKKIWNAVTTVLLVLAILLTALLWGVKLIGMDVFVVQSGSMEPSYPVGALVYVKEVDAASLAVGDVITFELGGGVRGTHRITEVIESDSALAFRTKGDANAHADGSLVTPENLVGKVLFSFPYLGFFVAAIQQPPGMYIAMAAAVVILLFTILPDLIFDKKKKTQKQEDTP